MVNLLKEIEISNDAMRLGGLVHHVIYDYTKKCVENGLDSDFELMSSLIEKMFTSSKLPESYYKKFRHHMLEFAERGINQDSILAYEKKFHVEFEPGKFLDGIIDRVNCYRIDKGSVIEIIDYKHQSNVMTEQEVFDDLQLSLYKMAACQFLFPGYDYVRTGIYHTKYNFIRWSPMFSISDCSKEFDNNRAFLSRQWDRLINTPDDEYKPQHCSLCWKWGGCEIMLKNKCPLFKKGYDSKKDDFEFKIRMLRKMDIQRDNILKEIKEYMSDKEAVMIDGKEVGFLADESYKYKFNYFSSIADVIGIDTSDVYVSKSDAEKAIKKVIKFEDMDEVTLAEIESARFQTYSNKFKY
jgi:hypothetical protein